LAHWKAAGTSASTAAGSSPAAAAAAAVGAWPSITTT